WDREQTHTSIRNNFIEEVYEAVEAIDTQNNALLREELGDVLLQVIFHAQIAESEGAFNLQDVTTEECQKLIVRHPHIFGDTEAKTAEIVLENWDAIKKKTKGQTSVSDSLEGVSPALPALMRAIKLQKKAKDYYGNTKQDSFVLIRDIIHNDKKPLDRKTYGKLLFELCNAARIDGVDPEEALEKHNTAFIREIKSKEFC
ncbi:MAG TPA: nucleoside triphosphate pyrophosphohydrolase, partial [Clostridiales bacterium]|nr:nucleoside triphosphate pyrophosphohydrolase [Clostridiales bacterium]